MNEVVFLTPDLSTKLPLMYAEGGVHTGFPSPAQDYIDGTLDQNKQLVEHPAASFYARVKGTSMAPGIVEDDILLVNISLDTFDGCTAVPQGQANWRVFELQESHQTRTSLQMLYNQDR